MAEKKNQHYVPRFLLKKFALTTCGKQINLYNIKRNKLIEKAAIKQQASIDYFYGKGGITEDFLGYIETNNSPIIDSILEHKDILLDDKSRRSLLFFMLLQRHRTQYAAEEHSEMLDKMVMEFASNDSKLEDQLRDIATEFKNPELLVFQTFLNLPLIYDLDCKLLINKTKTPFIISDNPVVFYNYFLLKKRKSGGITGLVAKGLVAFLPISPSIQLFYYDKGVYWTKKNKVIGLINENDIRGLNCLQFLNANHNIYFNELFTVSRLNELVDSFSKHRRKTKTNVNHYVVDGEPDINDELLHYFPEEIRFEYEMSFYKLTKTAKDYDLGGKMVHMRDEEFVRVHREFANKVNEGRYNPIEFEKFLTEKVTESQ